MPDSGEVGNFINEGFGMAQVIPLRVCNSLLAVAALDRHPLGVGHVHHTTQDILLQVGALH